MMGRLSGVLLEKHPPQILVDVTGVGYELDVPMSTFCQLPATGQPVVLHTHLVVREDAHLLYGFASLAERDLFRQLLRISGVGAKMGLALLSGMDAGELAMAVAQQDVARLVRVPGVGRKTAERLLLELKGKLGVVAVTASAPVAGPAVDDALSALLALGYNEREASVAVGQADAGESVEHRIRAALKWLSRS